MSCKTRLIVMNFLQFAVWGTYLTSMGSYLAQVGLGSCIGLFYAMQGVVSLFMPALMGIIADRWVPAQKLLGLCHLLSALFMFGAGYYGMTAGENVEFIVLFAFFSMGIAFYMPTIGLGYSVAYSALDAEGLDAVRHFPAIRMFGTIGFICSMWMIDVLGFQTSHLQFFACAALGVVASAYAHTLPECAVYAEEEGGRSLSGLLGLRSFGLLRHRSLRLFFLFSMCMGVSLQITNGFANPYITSYQSIPTFADTFGVRHANLLISLSQVSETCCILLVPFAMKRWGIKRVMQIAMLAWVLRFGLFASGDPGNGVWMFLLSMVVYGVAFDFFNVSGSLFVDLMADPRQRSSAQGLFMFMTNGVGVTLGTLGAQAVVNHFVDFGSAEPQVDGWSWAWWVFAAYALVVLVAFSLLFRWKPGQPEGRTE